MQERVTDSSPRLPRARWQRWGGGGLIAAAAIQAAGLAGYYFTSVRMPSVAFAIADGLPLLAATAILLAVFPLALGSTGSNGVVAASVTGKVAFIAFGSFSLLAPATRLGFFFASFPAMGGVMATADGFEVLALITSVVAALVVVRARVAVGVARWSLLAASGLAVLAASVGSLNNYLGWVLAIGSIVAQLATGILYLLNRQRLGTGARGTANYLAE